MRLTLPGCALRGVTGDELMLSDLSRLNAQSRQLLLQNDRFAAALDNMSQGLVMFDDGAHLILCNRRYLELYGLSADVVKPGCSLREMIALRIDRGSFSTDDPEDYVANVLRARSRGESVDSVVELTDGLTIAVSSRVMPGGGW